MQMPIPDDWDGESFCKWAICWPDSVKWQAILSGLVEQPNQGRFWDFSTGNFLQTRQAFRPAYNYNFDLKECIMSCADLQVIADAIRSLSFGGSSGCGNSGVPACGSAGTSPGGAAPSENTGDIVEDCTPPPGFEDCAEYRSYKCGVAVSVVDKMGDDWQRVSGIFTPTGTLAQDLVPLLIAAILTPIPGDEIFVLATIILSAAAINIWDEVLSAIISATIEREAELVCALYNAFNVEEAVSNFNNVMLDELTQSTSQPVTFLASQVSSKWANFDNFNKLFDKDSLRSYPEGECDCEQPCENYNIVRFYPGQTNAGALMGILDNGSLDAESESFSLTSVLGSHENIPGYYVFFTVPEQYECVYLDIQTFNWTKENDGASAGMFPICGGGQANVEATDNTDLTSQLQGICLGPCGGLIIRGGSSVEFSIGVTVTSTECQ